MTSDFDLDRFSHVLAGLKHPLIRSAYVTAIGSDEPVLTLETDIDLRTNGEDDHERYLDLLLDLSDIRRTAERECGPVSRVDIKSRPLVH